MSTILCVYNQKTITDTFCFLKQTLYWNLNELHLHLFFQNSALLLDDTNMFRYYSMCGYINSADQCKYNTYKCFHSTQSSLLTKYKISIYKWNELIYCRYILWIIKIKDVNVI